MSEPTLEHITALGEANEVLTEAFATDRPTRELFAQDLRALRMAYDLIVPIILKNPHSICLGLREDARLVCTAICQGPGREPPVLPILLRGGPLMWRLGFGGVRRLLRFHKEFEQNSPLRPDALRLAIIGTRPEAFGRGHGWRILGHVEDHARACGLKEVYLEASADNYPRAIYARFGYAVTKQFDSVAGAIVVMVKPLAAEQN